MPARKQRVWSARSLRNLRGIHPDLRRVFDEALQKTPLDFTVIEGLRTKERQRQLVSSGASQTMNSRHLTGHAIDILPIGPDGKAAFDWPLYDQIAPVIKQIADGMGIDLEWGGDWKSFRDGPHFQLSWDKYPKEGNFTPLPVTKTQTATAAASVNKGNTTATLGAATGAVGSVVAASSDAPVPIQYALAGVIVVAALFLLWQAWKDKA